MYERMAFSAFVREVALAFVNDFPKHISDKQNSFFVVLRKNDFVMMPTSSVHSHLRNRHIVIPDMNLGPITFDRQGIRQLDSLDALVQFEGEVLMSRYQV